MSPSLGPVTCDRAPYVLVGWGKFRIVTTGARRVVTKRLFRWLRMSLMLAAVSAFDRICWGRVS